MQFMKKNFKRCLKSKLKCSKNVYGRKYTKNKYSNLIFISKVNFEVYDLLITFLVTFFNLWDNQSFWFKLFNIKFFQKISFSKNIKNKFKMIKLLLKDSQ